MPTPVHVTLPTGQVRPLVPALSPADLDAFASWDGSTSLARDLWVSVLARRLGVAEDQAAPSWPDAFWMRLALLIFGHTGGIATVEDAAEAVRLSVR